jgi:hypothetical protein
LIINLVHANKIPLLPYLFWITSLKFVNEWLQDIY